MYTVLARKYRSQSFDDIVGQQPVARTLKNAIKTGRVAHAFLFVGTRGIGKTTMARVLAKALNCHSVDAPTTEPCCKCSSCVDVNLGEDVDVVEIDGASNNGVENVRELRQNAIYRPARSRYKIYIIDEVHMLSTGAFNALLKILEEPPAHVKFIFATTEPNKVIPTIQSRCQRYDFNNISPAAIAEHLKLVLQKENIQYKDDLVLHLARMANGSMRDGLSLLDRLISTGLEPLSVELLEEFLGCPNSEKIYNLTCRIGENDAAGTLNQVDDLINSGLSEVQILDALVDYMRNLMVAKSAGPKSQLLILTAQQRDQIAGLVEKFDIAGLVYSITTLEKLRWSIKNSETARALLEACFLRFALSEHFLNVDQLLNQLQRTGPTGVKKKLTSVDPLPAPAKSNHKSPPEKVETQETSYDFPPLDDLNSVKNNWNKIIETLLAKLGPGTAGAIGLAKPAEFSKDVLTLAFEKTTGKTLCESNGRKEKIQAELSKCFARRVRVKFELRERPEKTDPPSSETPKPKPANRRDLTEQISRDPAVKEILQQFGAKDFVIKANEVQ